jgi:hypothetical protein
MNLETYWLLVPLIGIGLSGFGWIALWITRSRAKPDHRAGGAVNRL